MRNSSVTVYIFLLFSSLFYNLLVLYFLYKRQTTTVVNHDWHITLTAIKSKPVTNSLIDTGPTVLKENQFSLKHKLT